MKKLFKSIPFVFSIVLFISGVLIIFFWASSYNSWTLREHLKTLSPLFLEINFFLIVLALVITVKQCFTLPQIKTFFGDIPRTVWLYLGGISIAGLILVMFVAPREHRIYYDEDIYQNIGQNIAYTKGEGSHFSS